MESLRGYFLIASPELLDNNFRQSVVLMVQHNDEGALGLILNRPAKATIKEVWEKVSESTCEREDNLHVGGPCQGPIMALHSDLSLADEEVLPGVYFAAQPENMEKLVDRTTGEVRFFIGFAGWSAGQLESELEIGSWRTLAATAEQVFEPNSDLWAEVTRQVADSELVSLLKIKHVPGDPSLN